MATSATRSFPTAQWVYRIEALWPNHLGHMTSVQRQPPQPSKGSTRSTDSSLITIKNTPNNVTPCGACHNTNPWKSANSPYFHEYTFSLEKRLQIFSLRPSPSSSPVAMASTLIASLLLGVRPGAPSSVCQSLICHFVHREPVHVLVY